VSGVGEWFLVWCATVWCGKCNNAFVLLSAGSRATRRFVRPLAASQGRLAANPREWFSAPGTRPKGPQRESNQSILSPCPARPTTAVHDACCCTLSTFWTKGGLTLATTKMAPPNFPCSSACSLHGWSPATLMHQLPENPTTTLWARSVPGREARRHRKIQ
jgi:hypothetical protein